MKRNKLDAIFSDCIRERADYVCEACGNDYRHRSHMGLHCSHIFSRRHRSVRWCVDNAVAHCFSCHHRLGGSPVEFYHWASKYLGDARLEILRERHLVVVKYTKSDLEECYQHYKGQMKLLLQQRKDGVIGKLDLVSWQ